jgi:hypothetical protein
MTPYAGPLLEAATASGDCKVPVEQFPVLRHKITNVRCGPSHECLDVVREAVITISRVEKGMVKKCSATWSVKLYVRNTWSRH